MNRRFARRVVFVTAPLAVVLTLACAGGGRDDAGTTSTGVVAGGSSAAAPAAAADAGRVATVAVGQPLVMTRTILGARTVVEVVVADVQPNTASGNQFRKPERGQFVTVKVTVTAKEGKYVADPGRFKLVGADGATVEAAWPVKDPPLRWTEITAGQNATGYVTFDAASGAEKGARIALKDWAAEGDAGYWGPIA